MKKTKIIISILAVILFFTACKRDDNVKINSVIEQNQNLDTVKEVNENSTPPDDDIDKNVLTDADKEMFCEQAELLGEQLINFVILNNSLVGTNELTDLEVYRFISTMFKYRDEENYPYSDYVRAQTENGTHSIYTFDKVEKIVKELFNIDDWFCSSREERNMDAGNYEIPINYEVESNFLYENMQIKILDSENLIELKFLLKLFIEEDLQEIGEYKIIFEIVDENDDKFLRFQSFEPIEIETANIAKKIFNDQKDMCKQAELIADQLMNFAVENKSLVGVEKLSDHEVFKFIATMFYHEYNKDYPYLDSVIIKGNPLRAIYSLEDTQRIAKELFDIDNWFFSSRSFKEENNEYEVSLSQGFGMTFSYENMQVKMLDESNFIEVEFLLTSHIGFKGEPGWSEIGIFRITFEIMHDDGNKFLRFRSLKPIE